MPDYTLGLFANLYPRYVGDSRGIFVKRMVDELENRGVRVIKSVKRSTNPLAYFSFYTDSFFKSLNKDIDLFQAEYIPHSSIIPALMKRNKPLILKFHGDDGLIYPFKNRFNRALINFSLKRADHVITCSEALKKSIIALGYKDEDISVIPNGFDSSLFKPLDKSTCRIEFSLPESAVICLYAGRLHPMKGINEIIAAAAENPDITFVFGGIGKIPEHTENCIILGNIEPKKMPLLFNAADFLVLPTYSEGLGLVLMESLACEIPVIASNVGGCPEVVKDGRSGVLIEPKSVNSLSTAIRWMAENPLELEKMGVFGRNDILNRYNSVEITEKTINLHKSLLNK